MYIYRKRGRSRDRDNRGGNRHGGDDRRGRYLISAQTRNLNCHYSEKEEICK